MSEASPEKPARRLSLAGSILKKLFLGLSVACMILTAFYLIYHQGWRDVTHGRILRQANDLFSEVEDVQEARIYLMMGEGKPDGTFPIGMYGKRPETYGSVDLKGETLENFLEMWRLQDIDLSGSGAGCHEPAYGFVLRRCGKAPKIATICWGCSNVQVEAYPGCAGTVSFDPRSVNGKKLLEFCNNLLPYKKHQ